MRPGSCPRQPPSLPVRSRSVRQAIAAALPVVLALILLPPLAFASPPDPSWVAGFYDGADGDDIVSLIYDTSAANQTAPSHLGPLPCLLDMYLDGIVRHIPDRHFTRGPRSPPVLRSPEFVSVFNALPPPTSLMEAPVTLPSLVKFCPSRCCDPKMNATSQLMLCPQCRSTIAQGLAFPRSAARDSTSPAPPVAQRTRRPEVLGNLRETSGSSAPRRLQDLLPQIPTHPGISPKGPIRPELSCRRTSKTYRRAL